MWLACVRLAWEWWRRFVLGKKDLTNPKTPSHTLNNKSMHTLHIEQRLCSCFPLTKEGATLTTSVQG